MLVEKITKRCTFCKRNRVGSKFAKSPFNKDQLDNWCNDCRKLNVRDIEELMHYCRENNRPFNNDLWKTALKECELKIKKDRFSVEKTAEELDALLITKSIGYYFSKMNLKHSYAGYEPLSGKNDSTFVPEELKEKWGYGYDPDLYTLFEKKWNKLIRSYSEKTEMHTEALITYIRYRVLEEKATAMGDIKQSKEWGELAGKAGDKAKINPSQMSKADISGGVDVISQLFEAVESEVGIIPLLPKLLEQPLDDADMVIWCNVNYIRRLEEREPVSYRDVYQFYESMLEEHYKQNGWNDEEIAKFMAKRNNVFRDLEKVYIEPLYEKHTIDEEGDD